MISQDLHFKLPRSVQQSIYKEKLVPYKTTDSFPPSTHHLFLFKILITMTITLKKINSSIFVTVVLTKIILFTIFPNINLLSSDYQVNSINARTRSLIMNLWKQATNFVRPAIPEDSTQTFKCYVKKQTITEQIPTYDNNIFTF